MQISCGMWEGGWGLLYIDLDCFNKGYLLNIIDIVFFTTFEIQEGILVFFRERVKK